MRFFKAGFACTWYLLFTKELILRQFGDIKLGDLSRLTMLTGMPTTLMLCKFEYWSRSIWSCSRVTERVDEHVISFTVFVPTAEMRHVWRCTATKSTSATWIASSTNNPTMPTQVCEAQGCLLISLDYCQTFVSSSNVFLMMQTMGA